MSEEPDRLTRVEVHVEYLRTDVRELRDDVRTLLARPSTLGQVGAFVGAHWKLLLVLTLTLSGAGWAPPLLAALK